MPNLTWWIIALPLLAGVLLPLQAGINSQLARSIDSVLAAALISFAVGTLGLLTLVLVQRELPSLENLRQLQAWHWLGGLLGAFFIATAAYASPRAGALLFMLLVLAGQMAMALLLDHFGWAGYREAPITPGKVAGLLLVVAGIWLIQRS